MRKAIAFRMLMLGLVPMMAWAGSSFASTLVGNAVTVVREVKGLQERQERILIVDDDVFQDEEVVTGPAAAARLIFKDNTNMSIGAGSRLRLTKLVFDPEPSKSKVAVKAALGVFRFATGTLPSSAYTIATPVANISVRGTVIEFTITGVGTTTVYVAQGAATVTSYDGTSVDLEAGQSTTVVAEGADGGHILASSPTPPETPSSDFARAVRNMTLMVRSDEPDTDFSTQSGGNSSGGPPRSSGNPFLGQPTFNNPRTNFSPPPGGGPTGLGSPGRSNVSSSSTSSSSSASSSSSSSSSSSTGGDSSSTSSGTGDASSGGTPIVTTKAALPDPTRVGTSSVAVITFTRTDGLTGDVTGTLAALSGIFSGAGATPGGFRIGPNGALEYTYVFKPTGRGDFAEALAFALTELGVDGVIELKGTGVGPSVAGLGKDGVAGTFDFGSTKKSISFTITNDTTDVGPDSLVGLTLQDAILSGPGAELFTLTGFNPGTVLGAGESLELMLTFDPDALARAGITLAADFLEQALLTIVTDMGAEFGGDGGQSLYYRLNWGFVIGFISEPAVASLLVVSVLGLALLRRRRLRR